MGKLEQFMDEEFKDNENARKLASMMMGMTGMAPAVGTSKAARPASRATAHAKNAAPPPEDIVKAAQAGDMGALMGLLAREHEKRTGTGVPAENKRGRTKPRGKKSAETLPAKDDNPSGFDRETLDALIGISSENGVSIDWLVTRAIKLYIRDYKATGRI